MKMLAANLKLLRDQHGLTQKQVADALNIERSTYTYYERGRTTPTFSRIYRLSKIFGVSIDTLAGINLLPGAGAPEDEHIFGGGAGTTITVQEPTPVPAIYRMHSPLASLPDAEQGLLLKFRQLSPGKKQELMEKLDQYLEELSME